VLCLWCGASVASADTLDLRAYSARLDETRSILMASRSTIPSFRGDYMARASALLRRTEAVRLLDGTVVAVDDSALAARLAPDDPAIASALRDIDADINKVSGLIRPPVIVPAEADAAVRRVLGARRGSSADLTVFELIGLWVSERLAGLLSDLAKTGIDVGLAPYLLAGVGVALAAIVAAILGRGLRERIRLEARAPGLSTSQGADPAIHLALADDALARGAIRAALHELYLYALAALAARETIRYDPSLTDRELLARAAGVAEIEPLRRLVGLHERVWFGLKPAAAADVAEARALATRIAA
jgi:hypothetical protein